MITVTTTDLASAHLADLAAAYPKAAASALTKMANQTKTKASSQIRSRFNLKARDVGQNMSVVNATWTKPESQVRASGKMIPLYEFSPVPDEPGRPLPTSGVSVMIVKGQRKVLRGAFIVRYKISGHKAVVERLGKTRFPIGSLLPTPSYREMKGMSVQQMFGTKTVLASLKAFVDEKLRDIFLHEIEYFQTKS